MIIMGFFFLMMFNLCWHYLTYIKNTSWNVMFMFMCVGVCSFMLPAAVRSGLKRTQVPSSSSSTTSIPLLGTSWASCSLSYTQEKHSFKKEHINCVVRQGNSCVERTDKKSDGFILWQKVQFCLCKLLL